MAKDDIKLMSKAVSKRKSHVGIESHSKYFQITKIDQIFIRLNSCVGFFVLIVFEKNVPSNL